MKHASGLLLLLFAFAAIGAENVFDRKAWESSPEAYFLTAEERREWKRVTDNDAARRFVAAFRTRRGPDFAAEVERRARVVDERLAVGELPASRSLRGRIVMLLGAPAEVRTRHIPKPYRGSMGVTTMGRSGAVASTPMTSRGMGAEGWLEYTFQFAPRPEVGIGGEGWTVVIEADVISGKDSLKHGRDRKRLEAILEAAARLDLDAAP